MSPLMQLVAAETTGRNAHHGQFRRDGVTPYWVHPMDVASRFLHEEIDQQVVAYLHDTLEDTNLTAGELLKRGFSTEQVEAIVVLTKVKGQSYDDYIKEVAANPLALRVKLADMQSNLDDSPSDKQIEKYTKAINLLNKEIK